MLLVLLRYLLSLSCRRVISPQVSSSPVEGPLAHLPEGRIRPEYHHAQLGSSDISSYLFLSQILPPTAFPVSSNAHSRKFVTLYSLCKGSWYTVMSIYSLWTRGTSYSCVANLTRRNTPYLCLALLCGEFYENIVVLIKRQDNGSCP
jgi:hypothetical protein